MADTNDAIRGLPPCPNCDMGAGLRDADPMEFMLTLPYDMKHCDTCGASYVVNHHKGGELQRLPAAEGW